MACGGRTSYSSASSVASAGGADAGDEKDATSSCDPPGTEDATYRGNFSLSYRPDAPVPFWVEGGISPFAMDNTTSCNTGIWSDPYCFVPRQNIGLALPSSLPTAGQVAVYDGSSLLVSLDAGDYLKSSQFASSLRWSAGDTLTLSASGAEVEAFRASIVAPAAPSDLNPPFASTLDISVGSDFVLSWSPEGRTCDQTRFLLSNLDVGTVICTVDDIKGNIRVAASLLTQFLDQSSSAALTRTRSVFVRTQSATLEIDAQATRSVNVNPVP